MRATSVPSIANQRLIPLSARDEWEDALHGIPHAFAHTWISCQAMQHTTGAPTFLYVWENTSSRFVCAVSERTYRGCTDVFTPYGFGGLVGIGEPDGLIAQWRSLAVERGWVCGYVGMNPLLSRREWFDEQDVFEYNDLYIVDLHQSEEELFSRLSTNRRRQVRAAASSLHSVGIARTGDVQFLRDHLNSFLQERGAAGNYVFDRRTIEMLADASHSFIVSGENEQGIAAAALFVFTPYVAEYFAGISLPSGRALSASLLWRGMLELKRRGIPFLNLGGGVRRDDGIAEFKMRFGADRFALFALKQVYDEGLYHDLCETVNADPADRTGYFPAYRASHRS